MSRHTRSSSRSVRERSSSVWTCPAIDRSWPLNRWGDLAKHNLRPGGRFVFNVPAEHLAGEATGIHPLQAALARALERHSDAAFHQRTGTADRAAFEAMLGAAGFVGVEAGRVRYAVPQGELLELMRLPAMIGRVAPGLGSQAREAVLADVASRIDPATTVDVSWVIFVAERG